MNTQAEFVAQPAVAPAKVLTLSPQDKTRVLAAVSFHVNGHSIPKANTNGVQLFERLHGEEFLNGFFEHNLETINKLGGLPEFSFFRTIHDDLIGKKVTALLINGLLVTGYLGVNGYNGEIFDRTKDLGIVEGEGVTNVRPTPVFYAQMLTGNTNEFTQLPETVIEEISFVNVVAVNDRLPIDGVPVITTATYEGAKVPLINDDQRNSKIIEKHRAEVAKEKAHTILAAKRRKKNAAERKARRNNRK